MKREAIELRYGMPVYYAIGAWQQRGYKVSEQYGELHIAGENVKVVLQSGRLSVTVKLEEPVQRQRKIPREGRFTFSDKIVEAVNEYLDLASKRLTPTQLATFSREWRDVINLAEQLGYDVSWEVRGFSDWSGLCGVFVIVFKHETTEITTRVHKGKWSIELEGDDEAGCYTADDEDAQACLEYLLTSGAGDGRQSA